MAQIRKLYEIRVRKIFAEALERIRQGKKPNLYRLMIKHGYAKTSAHAGKVTKTKAWQDALSNVEDDKIVSRFGKIAKGEIKGGGVREQIQAGVEVFKLKKRYPDKDKTGEVPTLKLIIEKKKKSKDE